MIVNCGVKSWKRQRSCRGTIHDDGDDVMFLVYNFWQSFVKKQFVFFKTRWYGLFLGPELSDRSSGRADRLWLIVCHSEHASDFHSSLRQSTCLALSITLCVCERADICKCWLAHAVSARFYKKLQFITLLRRSCVHKHIKNSIAVFDLFINAESPLTVW